MVQFIAEVSSNHQCDLSRALDFIDCAADIGCDAVKFQLFKIDELFSKEILENSKPHRERRNWELPLNFLPYLKERCIKRNILFACSPFYQGAVSELLPFVDFYKIASYEILCSKLLALCAKTGKDVIISTGMANIDEIHNAVSVLKANGCEKPIILHCNSAYPTPCKDANLAAIEFIRKRTNCEIGWSDHTVSPGVIFRAINKWGAKFIEFHLDLDRKGSEYKSGHCWLPDDISKVIEEIKNGFIADGNSFKEPSISELPDRYWRADPDDELRPMKCIRANWQDY